MKKLILMLMLLVAASAGWAQAPGIFNYQGVARNSVGNVLVNKSISLRLTIHDGSATGATVYSETRGVTTNPFGLFNVQVGSSGATAVTGTITGVNWTLGAKYIQVEIDPNGGASFINVGTAQLVSVPYAMSSLTTGDIVLPFTKSQGSGTTLFGLTNTGTAGAGSFSVSNTGSSAAALTAATNGTGFALQASSSNATPKALRTIGGLQFTGIGEGLNKVLTTDAAGNATWQSAAAVGAVSGTGTVNFIPKWTPNTSTLGNSLLFDDGSSVGLGTATPDHRFTVSHGGSTGISSTSTSGFSVIDINAQNGDAALRFQSAGVSQWNLRNRPTDNYLEFFELGGGGGSRMVIQDGTGNVGIGESVNPDHRLTVLHNGATGIVSRSAAGSGSFSVIDIDADNGDAALRFQKAGVSEWNIRNRPADDYLEFFELGGGGSRMVIQDGTGNVGIGETTSPVYRLDVLHGGATGIRSRSSSSFSLVDIDAANGDAALRFLKAGTSMWNLRNRPADDYFELFELGGGGSRLVVQNGTGNVGIGETTNPIYKLDVLHGGATGIRSRSSSSFSLMDVDAANGDAALRFLKAGTAMWNIRNRPADDYLEIFELGGGGSRLVVQNGTGNVGIGETTNPIYKLDVLHGGATGIRSRSSSSFSLMDVDAANGDAALRFLNAGVGQWNIRNNPATNDLQIFELGGGGERFRIENGTGNVVVTGNLSKGGGSFKIDDPIDPENKYLYHSFVESPDMMNIYNGNVTTDANGKVTVEMPKYFEALNMEFRYQLTVMGQFAQAIISKKISGNQFEIQTDKPNVEVSWQVTGIRHDAYANKNRIPNEVEKEAVNKGKYLHPDAFNQPKEKGINYLPSNAAGESINVNVNTTPVKNERAAEPATGSVAATVAVPAKKVLVEPEASSTKDMPKAEAAKATPAKADAGSTADTKPLEAKKKVEEDMSKSSVGEPSKADDKTGKKAD